MNAPGADKPRILMCVQQDFVFRDLKEGGSLDRLVTEFELSFVLGGNVSEDMLRPYGQIICRHRTDRVRLWLWNNLSILQSIHRWRPIVGKMARNYFNRKLVNNYRGMLPVLVAIERLGLCAPVTALVGWIMNLWVRRAVNAHKYGPFDAVVAPSVMRDLVADDLVRWAKHEKIPSLLLQMNLDNFNIKMPTMRSDYAAVWGEQSWYLARLVQRYPRQRIMVVGSPRLDGYADLEVTKAEARHALGLPVDGRVLLFCGASTVFDETAALTEIDQAIESGRLPGDVTVLYKPHPKGMAKGSGAPFDSQAVRHVRLYRSPGESVWTPLGEYGRLFAAADAVITPFSTMGVEAGLASLPVLCVGYHRQRPNYWQFAEFVHLKTYYDNGWSLVCTDPDQLIEQVDRLIARIGDPRVAMEAYRATGTVIYRDERPYGERLSQAIWRIIHRTDPEQSSVADIIDDVTSKARAAAE